jgi:hypothetical protein
MGMDVIVADFAKAIERVDGRRPIAVNQRSKEPFGPGIGPHTESAAVTLVMNELNAEQPNRYPSFETGVSYPAMKRQKCDLCLGTAPSWDWAIEIKLLRFLGDNGQPNDNILMHILSPYPEHRSALTDCSKLLASGLAGRKAILIYGFESEGWPLAPAIDAFEMLAKARVNVGPRSEAAFENLVHPVHSSGRVFGWEITATTAS